MCKGIYLVVALANLATVAWFLILSADERTMVQDRLAGKPAGNQT